MLFGFDQVPEGEEGTESLFVALRSLAVLQCNRIQYDFVGERHAIESSMTSLANDGRQVASFRALFTPESLARRRKIDGADLCAAVLKCRCFGRPDETVAVFQNPNEVARFSVDGSR